MTRDQLIKYCADFIYEGNKDIFDNSKERFNVINLGMSIVELIDDLESKGLLKLEEE